MHNKTYLKFIKNVVLGRKVITTQRLCGAFDIDFDKFENTGGRLVVFDMDDTLTYFLGQLPQRSKSLLESLKKRGFEVAIFSNCGKKRSDELNEIFEPLGIYSLMRSDKPKADGFLDVCRHYGIEPVDAMMVGDKLGTDMYGAYRAGFGERVLVEPYSKVFGGEKAKIWHRLIRFIEKFLAK